MTFVPLQAFSVNVNVSGSVTVCTGSQTVTGAVVKYVPAGGGASYSGITVAGGSYSILIPSGNYSRVIFSKPGFDTTFLNNVTVPANPSFTLNACLYETANPAGNLSAVLPPSGNAVQLSWQEPVGSYELLYDDGMQDGFNIWASSGNSYALKFSPLSFPVQIKGGKVHIGLPSNYPAQYNHAPFKVAVYDVNTPTGLPGNKLAEVSVTPSGYEWIDFQFPSQVTLGNGDFFLVMTQETNYPNATGIGVDLTSPRFRSWSRNGSQGWVPAQGNFMIRALVNGPGGPACLQTSSPSAVQNYQVYRLRQGEEQNPSVWVPLTLTQNLSYNDNSWISLPCGPYRWAVKTLYTGNRWSPPAFSNVIGKCWTAPVIININLSCPSHPVKGTRVKLTNQVYPDTVYSAILDTNHRVIFPNVWKGAYNVRVNHFGFTTYTSQRNIYTTDTINIELQQVKSPPSGLQVDGKTLQSRWNTPTYCDTLFSERWTSGSFSTQGWTVTPVYTNWKISYNRGNPAPSAYFDWNPQLINYDQSLQSPMISGTGSGLTIVGYDVFLDNYSTTTQNRLAVEIWSGSTWNTIKVYTNQGGGIPWTSDQMDVTSLTGGNDFRIRFRAFGENSFDINGWNVDNIYAIASEAPQQMAQCIIGYYFLLNSAISGFSPGNEYMIPGTQVQYGQTYDGCVEAIYGSGISQTDCVNFQSTFLWPVTNFRGDTLQNAVFLQWDKPDIPGSGTPVGLIGYSVYRDSLLVAFVPADTLFYYDLNLSQGTYSYQVSARYNLTPYGFPGMSDESYRQGPVSLYISYGRLLPFTENWDLGTFTLNNWTFSPDQGNWVVDPVNGKPPPSAVFNWDPPVASYSYALESPGLDPATYHCAGIWLDFMLKLEDYTSDSSEFMDVEVYYNNSWHRKLSFANQGNFDWTSYHIDLSEVRLRGFRIRFVARGASTNNILHWMLDNINVYGICYAPDNLSADAAGYDVNLSWSPPSCTGGGMILDEGFEGQLFPPASWSQVIRDTISTWKQGGKNTPAGVHSGDYSAQLSWDYSHQDEWLIVHDVYVSGNLTFWSNCYQGSVHGDHYFVQLSQDHGLNWSTLLDLSALPVYPQNNGFNTWQQPYVVDMAAYRGAVVDLAWHAVDHDSLGLWYSWAIDDCSIGSTPLNLSGYDVYRRSPDTNVFVKINPLPLNDTVYTDSGLAAGPYRYYVLALLGECTQGTPSDTVLVDVITSAGKRSDGGIRVFPNPFTDRLRLVTEIPFDKGYIYNGLGVVVLRPGASQIRSGELDLSGLDPGAYFLRLESREATSTIVLLKSKQW